MNQRQVMVAVFAFLTAALTVPTWQASNLASSRFSYLLWSAGQSLVSITVLMLVLTLVYGGFRKASSAFVVCGLIAIVFGLSLRAAAPILFEHAAPALTSAGSGTWLNTTIREHVSPASGFSISNSVLAAKVKLPDGNVEEALTSNRYDRDGVNVELYRDRAGVLWIGGPHEDTAAQGGGTIFLLGLLGALAGLGAKSQRIRGCTDRLFDRWLSD